MPRWYDRIIKNAEAIKFRHLAFIDYLDLCYLSCAKISISNNIVFVIFYRNLIILILRQSYTKTI